MDAPEPVRAYNGENRVQTFCGWFETMEGDMPEQPSLIMIQFLTWVADRPRNYAQTMEAWRSSCPRLSVWEDAIIDGLIRIENNANRSIRLTSRGAAMLAKAAPESADAPDAAPAKVLYRKTPAVAHAAAF
jgi:hypothetical protein